MSRIPNDNPESVEMTINCVQCMSSFKCGFNLDDAITTETIRVYICKNPKCPNYGLLQVDMDALE